MTINEMILVLQAFKDGKQIQGRAPGSKLPWSTLHIDPSWDFSRNEYRVEPKPLVIYANVYQDSEGECIGQTVSVNREYVLESDCSSSVVRRGAKFVEVVE